MRVHIGGGAGSGKTTLAARLSSALNAQVVDLDVAGYSPAWTPEEIATRRRDLVGQLSSTDRWVTAGTFVDWAEPVFEMADVIIFLDVSFSTAVRRIIVRHAKASLSGTNQFKGLRTLWRFIRRTRRWYASTGTHDEAHGVPPGTTGITHLANTRECLGRFAEKVTICRTDQEVRRLFSTLASSW